MEELRPPFFVPRCCDGRRLGLSRVLERLLTRCPGAAWCLPSRVTLLPRHAAADRKEVAAPSRRVVGTSAATNACGPALCCHEQRLQLLAWGSSPLRVEPAGRDGWLRRGSLSPRWHRVTVSDPRSALSDPCIYDPENPPSPHSARSEDELSSDYTLTLSAWGPLTSAETCPMQCS